jgi:peptidyl-prolyl cis-trans isomerase C
MKLEEARALLLAEAVRQGIVGGGDAAIEALLEREVKTPQPTDAECRRWYERNPRRLRSGDLVEARHILFAITPRVPPAALRAEAAEVHASVYRDAASFASAAARYSNCPSAAQGGALGQLGRGDSVPEFEAALFAGERLGVLPELVSTRHGFHVVLVARRIPGRAVPFEEAHAQVARMLEERSLAVAMRQYLARLSGGSRLVQ